MEKIRRIICSGLVLCILVSILSVHVFALSENKAEASQLPTTSVTSDTLNDCVEEAITCEIVEATDNSRSASSGTCGDNIIWTLDSEGVLTVTGEGTIPESAFSGDESIISVSIEGEITAIESFAFAECANIQSVSISDNVTAIGSYSFYYCDNLTSVKIGKGVTSMGWPFLGCSKLSELFIDKDNPSYSSDDSAVLFNKDMTKLIRASQGLSGKYSVPDSVVTIADCAFYHCYDLTEIDFGKNVSSIGSLAFDICGLTSASIPDSVAYIGSCAFRNCYDLSTAVIPDGLTCIESELFYGCNNLTQLILPNSINSVGDDAFLGCTQLSDVYYGGSIDQWEAISYGDNNDNLLEATVHFNSTGPSLTGYVLYFCKWDAENQIAYFGDLDSVENGTNLGNQVTEATDTSFLEYVDTLVGTYVLVVTKAREDGMLLPDTLISIQASDTGIGSVSTADSSVIVIDGKSYLVSMNIASPEQYIGYLVSYSIVDGTIARIEIIETSSQALYFSEWDDSTQTAYFGRIAQDEMVVTNETDTAFLSNLDSLIGQYVLVDSMIINGENQIRSITAVESRFGRVDDESILCTLTIDGMEYTIASADILNPVQTNDYVLYHLSGGVIVDVEALSAVEYIFAEWNNSSSIISLRLYADSEDEIQYQLSDLISEEATARLSALSAGARVRIIHDECGFVHDVTAASFSKPIYHASSLMDDEVININQLIREINANSPATLIISNSDVDEWYQVWDDLTLFYDTLADGDAALKHQFEQMDICEAILLNALECATNDESSYAWAAAVADKTVSISKDFLSKLEKTIKINKGWELMPDTDLDQLSDQQKKELKETFEKELENSGFASAVSALKSSANFLDFLMDTAETASDLIEKTTIYLELWYVSDSMATVLDNMLLKIPEENDFAAMRSAIEFCSDQIRETNREQFQTGALLQANFMTGGKEAITKGVSFLWGKVTDKVKASHPAVAVLLLAYQVGKTITNLTFNTDNISEDLYKLRIVSWYQSFLQSSIIPIRTQFNDSKTEENANVLLNAVALLHSFAIQECDIACSYSDAVEEAVANKIMGGADDDAKTALKVYATTAQETIIRNNVDAATHWVYELEGDYPEYYPYYAALIGEDRYDNALGDSAEDDTGEDAGTTGVQIVTQPVDVAVAIGETATVTVEATGNGLTYTWYYKNVGASKFSKTTAFTGPTYSVTMSEARDGRQIYCVITDANGYSVTTDTVTLSMAKTPLEIITQPVDVTVADGEVAEVSIEAAGDGLTYEWYFMNAGGTKFSKTSSFTGPTYSVTMSAARDGRQVYCLVADQYGNEVQSDTVTMTMYKTPLEIVTQPEDVTVAEGETAVVTVEATGDGLTYEWYYKNAGATKYTKTSTFTGPEYSLVMNASRSGRRVYCKITDAYGNTVKTNSVALTMETNELDILTQPEGFTIASGETGEICVEAVGDGLTYEWYYKNSTSSKFTKTSTFTGPTYTLTMNSSRSGRHVYCVITDQYGDSMLTDIVTLNMASDLELLSQPEDIEVSAGETAEVTVDAIGEDLTYTWYYRNAGATAFTRTTSFTGDSYSVKMTAARSGREVYCVVKDANGNTVATDVVMLNVLS